MSLADLLLNFSKDELLYMSDFLHKIPVSTTPSEIAAYFLRGDLNIVLSFIQIPVFDLDLFLGPSSKIIIEQSNEDELYYNLVHFSKIKNRNFRNGAPISENTKVGPKSHPLSFSSMSTLELPSSSLPQITYQGSLFDEK